jgi:hypothetical protein
MKRTLAYYERHAPDRLPPPEPWPDVEPPLGQRSAGNPIATDRQDPRTVPPSPDATDMAARKKVTGVERIHSNSKDATAAVAPSSTGRPIDAGKLSFIARDFVPAVGPSAPVVSNVRFADLDDDRRLEVLGCEMRYGLVFLLRPYAPADPIRLVSQLPAPSHVEVADVDRDGIRDLLVADLGEFQPSDHLNGAAVWLRGVQNPANPGSITFQPTIVPNLPRVADVEMADLDEDGRPDLIVAAFGWRRVGRLMWLRNTMGPTAATGRISVDQSAGASNGDRRQDLPHPPGASIAASAPMGSHVPNVAKPAIEAAGRAPGLAKSAFEEAVLDPRAGAIHVIPVDLNRDGHIDLVSVIAQEHEEVIALLNDGRGHFESKSVYAAPHPNWGSSGIQVVDLDRDGDLDVLLTHGDMFDDFLIKPYHGIQWLENRGTFPFTPHTLCSLPGVHRALAVDLDADGDLDIVAAALMPDAPAMPRRSGAAPATPALQNLPSLVWLEQTTPGVFVRHTLERGHPRHATMDAADYDHDGDIDLVIGNMATSSVTEPPLRGWVEVWENVSRRSGNPDAHADRER